MSIFKKIIGLFKPQPTTDQTSIEASENKQTEPAQQKRENPQSKEFKHKNKKTHNHKKSSSNKHSNKYENDHRPKKNQNHRNKKSNQHHKSDRPRKNNRHQNRRPKSRQAPAPIKPQGKEFKDLGLHPKLVELLAKSNFTHATTVQEKSLAHTIAGKNIFCSSETGSGKTLSFLIPMIQKFYNNEISQALIICPTREIAIQINKTLTKLGDESLTLSLIHI